MALPYAVARFNKRYTDRFIEPLVRHTRGFAVIHHTGRRSGVAYATPLKLFGEGDTRIVALTYGPRAQWFQNVRVGGGVVETDGMVRTIERADHVGRETAWAQLPRHVRMALRILTVHDFATITMGGAASCAQVQPERERSRGAQPRDPDSQGQ